MTTPATLDRIDDRARSLAQAAMAGELPEMVARARLAELVLDSQISQSVAWAKIGLAVQQRYDLAENILALLLDRVLDENSPFDLQILTHGSLCGWARKLGMSVSQWDKAVRPVGVDAVSFRVSPLEPSREEVAVRSTGADEASARFHAALAFGGLSAEELVLSDWSDSEQFSDALDRASNLTGFAREPVRDQAGAAVLREIFGLPALCVPVNLAERSALLLRVRADHSLARRALVQMASLVCVEPPCLPGTSEVPVGELMLSLWDDFDPEHLEALMVRPAKAAHMVVMDALTPRPKPSRGTVRALMRTVRAASTAKAWVMTQDGVVTSFLATCTEAVSLFDDTNDAGAKGLKLASAADAGARWPALAARVALFPGTPLGGSADLVAATMRRLLDAAHANDVEERIAARHRRGLGASPFERQAAA